MIDSADEKVRELLARATEGLPKDAKPAQTAETLRKFVNRFVTTKDFSVGMATASEVARTAQGDCTEHAVLLAALLRAAGIPSRTVAGLLYVDEFIDQTNVFGYHMWTQAWLDGRWVDLDATLDVAFDATHIALAVGALNDPAVTNDMVAMSALTGHVSVRVLEPPK